MKHILLLLLVSTAATACLDGTPDGTQNGTATSELTATGSGAKTNTVCQQVWECDPICGRYQNGVLVRYPTNVLHNECDDGTDTVIHRDPCGENCY